MESRACVFIDGENLRHSIRDAFREDDLFSAGDYLPRDANWSAFFDWIVLAATGGTHQRLRAYWFVTREIDCFPHHLSVLGRRENAGELRTVLSRHAAYHEILKDLEGEALYQRMSQFLERLRANERRIEQRFNTWRDVQNGISLRHRAVEFRRAGAISYNLFENRFGREKCVDIQLACDMIMLRHMYDVAVIVSGDQDYVPAAQIVKDSGKTVVNVAFEKRNGTLVPGGARRLNIVTDASLNVPYDKLRNFMGFSVPHAERAAVRISEDD